MQRLLQLLRLSRPLNAVFAALTYMLGAGVARYLGIVQNSLAFWLGLVGLLFAQLGMLLLAEGFRPVEEPSEDGTNRSERVLVRNAALQASLGSLVAATLIALLLGQQGGMSPLALVFLTLSLGLVLAYAVPPVRLVDMGFGEFILAVHIAVIAPGLGFVLQGGTYHRVVGMVSFPLTLLALAYFLVLDFPRYALDEKFDRGSLLRSIGWERAISLHHGLVLAAYALLLLATLFGLSWGLVWPALLTLPFALLQIWWLRNIGMGARPVWSLLTVNALAVFGLTAYLLTFVFWLR